MLSSYKDPEVFAVDLETHRTVLGPERLTGRILVMALDLGTACGYALTWARPGLPYDPRAAFTIMGQFSLAAGPYDSGAIRIVRLRQMLEIARPQALFYEDVRYTPAEMPTRSNAHAIVARSATPTEWFGALKGCVAGWAENCGVPCQSFPIQTIKKRATGRGNAGKPEIIRAVNDLFGVALDPENHDSTGDDNVADAAMCLLLGMEQYARGLMPAG